ncbi:sensor histidine kinase [Bifidobacterium pullorum]|uniref:sensor histidine kinase n=1 Tax=Bifidobacterium pullorum TaxID=78448 RepID=UPI00374DF096
MVPIAIFMCLAQTSFAAARYGSSDPQFLWFMFSTLVAIPSGLLLLARDRHPEAVFWGSCALVIAFPFDSMLALMAMTSLLARRSSRAVTVRAIAALVGLHLRSKAIAASAEAKADAAASQAHTLQADLNNQQLADAIAAEAHDTLAHSLSLLALNASALQAESDKLCTMTQSSEDAVRTHADSIAQQAQQIRRQAAGALDEAHTIIDMLRHPEQAYVQLAPSDDTALTRESLNALITDARQAGMRVDTWIDIQQLSELDDALGKIAYRTIQEGLTNARRHAPDAPVALQIDALPRVGVHIHISNPLTADERTRPDRAGSGLTGIAARIHSAGGTCAYGADERGVFHIDARLPWIRNGAEQQPNVAGLA